MAEAYGIDIAGGFLRIYNNETEAHQIVGQLEMGRVVPLCRETALTSNAIPLHQVLSDLVAMVDNPKTSPATLEAATRNARSLLGSVRAEQERQAAISRVDHLPVMKVAK